MHVVAVPSELSLTQYYHKCSILVCYSLEPEFIFKNTIPLRSIRTMAQCVYVIVPPKWIWKNIKKKSRCD